MQMREEDVVEVLLQTQAHGPLQLGTDLDRQGETLQQ